MLKLDEKKFLFLLIFLHLAIALPLGYYLNAWVDEASTLHTTANGFFPAVTGALRDENQSPLYFILLSLWRMIDGSIFWTRVFSIWCSLLAIKVSFDVARRFLPENARKLAVTVFALHPFLFWASTETRGYSLIILLSALLLRFFYDAYLEENPPLKAKIFYFVIAVIALYTNYFIGFFLVGNFCALAALRRTKQAAQYIGHMAIVGLGFLPLAVVLSQQFGKRHDMGDKSLLEGVRNTWQHIQTFILPVNIFTDEKIWPAFARLWIFRAGAAVVVIGLAVKKFKGISANTIALGTISLLISLFLLSVVTLMGIGYANIRHGSMLLLPLIFFFAALLSDVFGKKGLIAWAVLLLFFIPFSLYQQFAGMVKRGDWQNVAAYVQANEKPGQTVLVFDSYDTIGFEAYYTGVNSTLPREGFFTWAHKNDFTAQDTLPQQIDALLSELPPDTNEVWLLTGELCDNPKTRSACQPLEEYFNSRYTIVDSKDFYLERVRLYRRK